MGNSSSSLEERVYDAAASNDSATLQKLLDRVQNQQPVVDRRLLEFRDREGRTPLIVAAARNHQRCVQLLLQHGASVHFMNCLAEAKGGTALHEAARNGATHAPVCELLLAYGANPFVANPVGRTPLEEAMLAGSFVIMDKMRQQALWLGMVAIKSTKYGGLTTPFKNRFMVVVPHFPCPKPDGPPEPSRKQLWVFRDNKELQPKCRVWLDGATCFRATSADVVLRLHPNHSEPRGDVVARYDRGYCLFLRPVSSLPAAQTDLDTLVALADPSAPQRPLAPAPAPAPQPTPPGPRPPTPPGPRTSAPPSGIPPTTGSTLMGLGQEGGLVDQLPSWSRRPSYVEAGRTGSAGGVEAGAGSSRGGNVSVSEGGRSNRVGSGGGLEGGRATSAAAPRGGEQEWMDRLDALPGESDLEFAARLASAIAAQQGHSQEGPAQSPPPPASALTPPPSAGTSAGPPLNYYPPIPSAESAPFSPAPQAAAAANPSSPAPSVAATASNLASSLYKAFFPPPASPAAPAGSPGPSGPPAGPTPQTQPSLPYADLAAPPGKLVEPSAPTLTEEDDDSQPACVICWSAPREVGLLHGSSVHKCVCRECAAGMKAGITPCPLCRQTVERVLNVFE